MSETGQEDRRDYKEPPIGKKIVGAVAWGFIAATLWLRKKITGKGSEIE